MIKLSYFVNILVLLLCLIGAWIIFSNQSQADFLGKEISKIDLKIKELTIAVEEAKKGQQDKLAREKRKNGELEEKEEISDKEISDLSRKRDEMKVILNENEKKIEIIAANIQKAKVSLAGVDKEIETSRNAFNGLISAIPILQSKVTSLENQILAQGDRRKELDDEILTYDQETEILKQHYNLTLSALQKDFYEHPWLERGERVTVAFSQVDLDSGILMLPVGKKHGLEKSMRFSVRAKGKPICQIRVKEIAFDHCIAMIIPLLGNPTQLLEVKYLDLIYL